MQLRALGNSDLHISPAALGIMTFGSKTAEQDAFRQLDMALGAGINLFDTAENYPSPVTPQSQGRSEEMLGRWIAARGIRARVAIATKVAGPGKAAGVVDMSHIRGPDRRLDRDNIQAAVHGSLRRLGTDYIDLYQVHWPERPVTTLGRSRFSYIPEAPGLVPIEETLGALGELVTAGKVRHIGVSNESPWGVMHYLATARERNLPRIVSMQSSYSLLDRQFELGLAEVALRERLGLLAYSPLARGLLSEPASAAAGTAATRPMTPARAAAVQAYGELARRHGLCLSQMALAFVRQKPFTAAVLMAATTAAQLENNLRSLDVTLSKELLKEIDQLHDERPNPR